MTFFNYLLYSTAFLSVVTVFYWLLLQRETFFGLNRVVLLSCMLLAVTGPLWPLPDAILQVKESVNDRWNTENWLVSELQLSIPQQGQSSTNKAETPVLESRSINWVPLVYWIITGLLVIRLIIQLFAIVWQLKKAEISPGKRYHLVSLQRDIAPFSFGKYLFVNPDKYTEEQFLQILEHEKLHIRLRHSWDLLLVECLTILQWFNPLVWAFRYLLVQNLEFQVDAAMLAKGEPKKTYQLHLLHIAVPNYPLSITTNYNQSLLKKRIKMMNSKRSSLHSSFKYLLLLPLVMGFISGRSA